jgi:hypothetical protein
VKFQFAALALAVSLTVSGAFAQSEPEESASSTTEPPAIVEAPTEIDAQPAGIARQPWEVIRDIVATVPSPIGVGLPGAVEGGFGPGGATAGMNLDGKFQLYSYTCGSARCTGLATDIWRALPREAQQSYIDAVLDALVAAFPDEPRYAVWVAGRDSKGNIGARVDLPSTGQRVYRFVGR